MVDHDGNPDRSEDGKEVRGGETRPPARAAVSTGLREAAWAGGSDAPELTEVKVGFIPLTDCAPLAVAAAMGFDRKYGIRMRPRREASWAAVRDKLLSGTIDAAHVLYGLVYGVQLGIGGPRHDMAVLMTLNQNGQAITLAEPLRRLGVTDGGALKRHIDASGGSGVFAHTFPTGTHAMWLYYWLAAHGIHPLTDAQTITVPPPQMVTKLRVGEMLGYSAGEPWNARAVRDGLGFTVATSQAIWPDHPEKVLATTREFVGRYPHTARALIMALLEAARFIDTPANQRTVARIVAGREYVDTDVGVVEGRLRGRYDDGLGNQWRDAHPLRFHGDGAVNYPYLSDGMWFMTQHRRWGLLRHDLEYRAIAARVNQLTLYAEAAGTLNVPLPDSPLRRSTLMDGRVWNGEDARHYAMSFAIRSESPRAAANASA